MIKKEAGYYLSHQCMFLFRNNDKFSIYDMQNKELIEINDLDAAKRVVFEYKENNEWIACDSLILENQNTTDNIILKEINNIVGQDVMEEAINWSNNIQEQYLSSKRNYLNKILIKSINN